MTDRPIAYEYILGLLNSRLLDYYLQRISTTFRGGYYAYSRQYIEQLPIRTIDFSDPEDVARHDRMVELVERMLALHEKLAEARIERERTVIGHQISATDRQIDRLVYELYGLTEEIAVVEGNARLRSAECGFPRAPRCVELPLLATARRAGCRAARAGRNGLLS